MSLKGLRLRPGDLRGVSIGPAREKKRRASRNRKAFDEHGTASPGATTISLEDLNDALRDPGARVGDHARRRLVQLDQRSRWRQSWLYRRGRPDGHARASTAR